MQSEGGSIIITSIIITIINILLLLIIIIIIIMININEINWVFITRGCSGREVQWMVVVLSNKTI